MKFYFSDIMLKKSIKPAIIVAISPTQITDNSEVNFSYTPILIIIIKYITKQYDLCINI